MAARPGASLFIQFAREPVVGEVKTRMIPHLSPAQARDLHSELVLWTAGTLVAADLGPVELAVAGEPGNPLFRQCLRAGVAALSVQRGTHLGERMYLALSAGLGRFEKVILVGSDCPGLDTGYLRSALAALDQADVVLGPALDGGYVLIGGRRVSRAMFEGITWGSSTVLSDTRQRLHSAGVVFTELPALADIDRPEDLVVWQTVRARRARARPGSGGGPVPP